MSVSPINPIAASLKARDQEFAREFQKMHKRDWWLWGYSIFVLLLFAFAVTAFCLPAVRSGVETIFRVNMVDVVFGLIALVVLFNVYAISQAILIKRLPRPPPHRQGHSDLPRDPATSYPFTAPV